MANWLVAFATPIFLARSAYGAYFLFGGIALLTVVVLATCMRETRGQSLEDIQDAFRQSSSRSSMAHASEALASVPMIPLMVQA